jgi:hypothetical protein
LRHTGERIPTGRPVRDRLARVWPVIITVVVIVPLLVLAFVRVQRRR